jgi:hypothetical protein
VQEQTGRLEKSVDLDNPKPSMRGKWVEIGKQTAENLAGMNRKERRAWLAKERKAGRVFKEKDIR